MEITSSSPIAAQAVTVSQNDADKVSSDFETFLKMLTVQLKNQDPLDPMESADFSMQLATFSGVEQQVKTNELLEALTQQSQSLGLSQISAWVGMQALAATSADFAGQPLDVHVKPAANTDGAVLVVKNDLGQEVERRKIDPLAGPVKWTGVTADGQQMLAGSYSFHVESYTGKDLLSTDQAEVYSYVTEVNSNAGNLSVVLASGDAFDADQISSLRTATDE